jgi:trans-aconitate methyltransferase
MTHTFDDEYWDQIWTGERASAMATSEPNPHLVEQVGVLEPGTALDAGCGAGAEAIWLATHGWQVTGADIAAAALARAAERAGANGVTGQVTWVQADLSTWQPGVTFDLVTTHYAHPAMPQLEFYDRLASWVSPGGTLLIVGHLHHDAAPDEAHPSSHGHGITHAHGSTHGHEHGNAGTGPPAEASATAAAITARLDPADWVVVTAAQSHRTVPGHDVALLDVVVRATRRP